MVVRFHPGVPVNLILEWIIMINSLRNRSLYQPNFYNDKMVFDWDKAAYLIRKYNVKYALAGLSGDWGNTGDYIFKDGKPLSKEDTYVYLSSKWAAPELRIALGHFDCFKSKSKTPGWDSDTFWPDSSLAILDGRVKYEP